MRRRSFIQGIAVFAAWPPVGRAQQAARSYSIAYLALSGDEDASLVKQRLGELGYREGKNLSFSFRSAEGQPERLPQLAADLVRAKPDVIVTGFGTETARAAQAATTAIPIVFTSVGDPIAAGIVKSLSQPGANITGLTSQTVEISSKRLQLLEELAPRGSGCRGYPVAGFSIHRRGAAGIADCRRRPRLSSRNLRGASGRSTPE